MNIKIIPLYKSPNILSILTTVRHEEIISVTSPATVLATRCRPWTTASLDDRIKALKKMLVAVNLEDVEIRPGNQGLLVLPGKTEAAPDPRLAEVIKTFNRQFASQPPLTTPKEGEPSGSSFLKLDIRGISFGDTPHITMNGNRRYGVGSRLENGYVIESITQEYILLQKGGESHYYYLPLLLPE